MNVFLIAAALALAGPHGDMKIDDYCRAAFESYGDQSRCVTRQKSAEQELLNLSYPDDAILAYCKGVIGPPEWGDTRACYNLQVKFKPKYEALAEARPERAAECEQKLEAQNWVGLAHCVSPGSTAYRSRDAANMMLRDTFIHR